MFNFEVKFKRQYGKIKLGFNIPVLNYYLYFSPFAYSRTPTVRTQGITSRCIDGKHVLFFDYDGMDYYQIEDELKYLQSQYDLSTAYVFKNDAEDSYHAVFLDKFSLKKALEIIKNSNCDFGYKSSPLYLRKKEWVLRHSEKGEREKPKFFKKIKSNNNKHEISSAHKRYLELHYFEDGLKMEKYKKEDGFSKISVCDYNTGNSIHKEAVK